MHPTFTLTYSRAFSTNKLLSTLLLLALPLLSWGQDFTGTYPFDGVSSGTPSPATGTTDPTSVPIATGVTFGSFSAVGTSTQPNVGSRFNFTNWPLGATNGLDTFTGLYGPNQYYTVTLTPQPGFTISLSSITFTLQRTSTGIRQCIVRSSVDNFANNLPASITQTNATLSVSGGTIFQITDATTAAQAGSTVTLGGAGYTNVSGPVTFRFYGFNAEASSGTFSIDDVKITGTATATNAPVISSFTPASGPVGTSTTISGAYFTGSSAVAFNGVAATNVTFTNATTLVATVPSGATSGPITVTTSGGTATSPTSFTVTAPTVTVSPTSLPVFSTAAGTTSAAQTYQVSGSSLNGTSLTITPSSSNFEVSLDGSNYATSASITLGGSSTLAATTIYVRLASGAPIGSASSTIANTNGAVTTNLTMTSVVVAPLVAKRWTGAAGTTSWFDAANWENGTLPSSTNDVVLDHRYVAAKYTVSLSSGASVAQSAVTVNSLRIRPFAGDSILFLIPNTNTIPATSTGAPALMLARTSVGDTALLISKKGAFTNLSGATTGVPFDLSGTNPTAFLLNGGSYYHRTIRTNTAVVENLSGATGTETGNFFFRVPSSSYAVAGTGRTYGNLILQRASGSSYISSGTNNLTINGNLVIESGVNFTITLTSNVVLKGNLVNAGNFRFDPATAGTTGRRLILQGTMPQEILGNAFGDPTGTATSYLGPDAQLEINNAAGVTLQMPVTLSSMLALTNGLLTTTATNALIMMPSATVTGGSSNSFVNGPVARLIPSIANSDGIYTSYVFPIGKGTSYHPLTLNINTQSSTTTYRAEQFEGDPGQNVTGSDLARVSKVGWFTIIPFSGTTVTQPTGFKGTISVPFTASDGITDPTATTLVVAKRADATQPWSNIGRSAATASMLTSAAFSGFSDFVLASTSANSTINPLPVTLISFSAVRQAGGLVKVAWATASEQHSAHFEVQRSLDGHLFTSINKVAATGTSTQAHAYTSLDTTAPAGQVYYRLRQVDTDNTATYSPTVTLAAFAPKLALYPNPAHDQLTVALAAGQAVQVFDLAGYLVQTTTLPASGQLNVSTLPAGTYLLRVVLPEQAIALRFTKE
jgi:hypothetical protein